MLHEKKSQSPRPRPVWFHVHDIPECTEFSEADPGLGAGRADLCGHRTVVLVTRVCE